MSTLLLFLHSLFRWLVLAFLLYSIARAFIGYTQNKTSTATDNTIRHLTATVAHIQLIIGMILYTQSPIVKNFWQDGEMGLHQVDLTFYGIIHIILMITAIVLLTVGSAMAKRRSLDKEKFKTILIWFTIALVLILIAIPWPFSPLSNRPLLRTL